MSMVSPDKPLGQKAYGSIPHLPGSRMGPGDHSCHEGQARIATMKTRDRRDRVYVQEKLDGSCVSVAKIDGEIIPLGRAGYRAISSKYEMHHLFHDWVRTRFAAFDRVLNDGERVVGEWLAQAHGTRYDLIDRDPFVAFDIMRGSARLPFEEMQARIGDEFYLPMTTTGPATIEEAMDWLGEFGFYGALDPVEGVVWRVERRTLKVTGPEWEWAVDFLVKYVRPDKIDGSYLDSVTNEEPVWNWRPA